jgi:Ca2+/H+ antiporter
MIIMCMYIYMLHIYTVIHAYLFIYKAPKTSPDRIGVYDKRETIRAHPHFSERSYDRTNHNGYGYLYKRGEHGTTGTSNYKSLSILEL